MVDSGDSEKIRRQFLAEFFLRLGYTFGVMPLAGCRLEDHTTVQDKNKGNDQLHITAAIDVVPSIRLRQLV